MVEPRDPYNIVVSTYGSGSTATARVDAMLPLGLAVALDDIASERARQDAKWGEQNHPNGTGKDVSWGLDDPGGAAEDAVTFREITERNAREGKLTWRDIALEEIAEAFAEADPVKLRAEVVQCASVFTAWAEAIDRAAAS